MKILHVIQNYFPSVGGPQYTMKHISEKLVALHNDTVEVCTTNSLYGPETKLFKKIEPAVETINKVTINRLPFIRWHYPLVELANKINAKATGKPLPYSFTKKRWSLDSPAIDEMMTKTAADVIMATTIIYNFSDYPLWRFKTKNPKPFVLYGAIHLHKELPSDSPLIKRAKNCDCYIANTEFERQELIKYGVDQHRIMTIGTGIDVENFQLDDNELNNFKQQHGIREDDILIGYIGRLVKGKGVGILLDSFRKLYDGNKNVKLLLAGGTTTYVAEIRQVIQAEQLPVILMENFDERFKPILYNSLDVFVLASQSESFGVVFLEAWACRKPVIGARMGAVSSLLNEGTDSLLFTPGDVEDLTHQLRKLIGDKNLCTRFGENGYKKVIKNYTWPVIVKRYRDAYELGIHNFKSIQKDKARVAIN